MSTDSVKAWRIVFERRDGSGVSSGIIYAHTREDAVSAFIHGDISHEVRLTENEDPNDLFYDASPAQYICTLEECDGPGDNDSSYVPSSNRIVYPPNTAPQLDEVNDFRVAPYVDVVVIGQTQEGHVAVMYYDREHRPVGKQILPVMGAIRFGVDLQKSALGIVAGLQGSDTD